MYCYWRIDHLYLLYFIASMKCTYVYKNALIQNIYRYLYSYDSVTALRKKTKWSFIWVWFYLPVDCVSNQDNPWNVGESLYRSTNWLPIVVLRTPPIFYWERLLLPCTKFPLFFCCLVHIDQLSFIFFYGTICNSQRINLQSDDFQNFLLFPFVMVFVHLLLFTSKVLPISL